MSRRSASRGGLGLLKKGRGAVVGTWRRLDSWMRADPKVQAILTWADENTLERTALVMVVHQCLLLWLAGPWLNKLSSTFGTNVVGLAVEIACMHREMLSC